jgi:predicted MFS family arabinose efflux permease
MKDHRMRDHGTSESQGAEIDPRAYLLALGMFAIGTDAYIVAGVLPQIADNLSTSLSAAGLVVSVFSLSYAVGSPIASAITTSWRRSIVLVGGLGVFALANLLSAASPSFASLLVTRVVAALAAGLVAPASYALASTMASSKNRGKMLAIVAAGFTGAMVLGVPLGVTASSYVGWRGAFAFVGVLGTVAAAAMLYAGVPDRRGGESEVTIRKQMRLVGRGEILFALAPFLLWSIANFGLYTFIVAILGRHVSARAIPIMLLLFGIGSIAGNFVGGALADRCGTRLPTKVILITLIGALGTVDATSTLPILEGANLIVWAVAMAALFTLQQQRMISIDGKQSNLLLALNNATLYFGVSIGAAVQGMVISVSSLEFVPVASAAIAGLALLALVLFPQPRSDTEEGRHQDASDRRRERHRKTVNG